MSLITVVIFLYMISHKLVQHTNAHVYSTLDISALFVAVCFVKISIYIHGFFYFKYISGLLRHLHFHFFFSWEIFHVFARNVAFGAMIYDKGLCDVHAGKSHMCAQHRVRWCITSEVLYIYFFIWSTPTSNIYICIYTIRSTHARKCFRR